MHVREENSPVSGEGSPFHHEGGQFPGVLISVSIQARLGLEFWRVGSRISGAGQAPKIGADSWSEKHLRAGIYESVPATQS